MAQLNDYLEASLLAALVRTLKMTTRAMGAARRRDAKNEGVATIKDGDEVFGTDMAAESEPETKTKTMPGRIALIGGVHRQRQ